MNLLLLTDGIFPYSIGGMQKHSFNLAKYLLKTGHTITLVHCVYNDDILPESDEVIAQLEGDAKNLFVITLRFPVINSLPGHYLKESYLYSKMVYDKVVERLNSYDFVYAKGFSAWYLLEMKSKGNPCPPVGVKFHGYEMYQPTKGLKAKLDAYLLREPVRWNNLHADYVFSYGGKVTQLIENLGVDSHRIIVIPSGIDDDWIRNEVSETVGSSTRNLLFIGRFEHRKGVNELHDALKTLIHNKNFVFHFIGPIPEEKKLIHERIIYHGKIMNKQQMVSEIDNCQVLVVPSHSEGMPNVILEGMARGLAVVATDVGAVEQLVSSENGIVIPPRNPKAIADAILKILQMKDEHLMSMRVASLRKVKERFLWNKIVKETASEIEKRIIQKQSIV
jgi:glycosyltransferase involved in cell wall biosynthesis